MTQPLSEMVEQFCNFQRRQRGKTAGGVGAYRWNLEQFLRFLQSREGRVPKVKDLTPTSIQVIIVRLSFPKFRRRAGSTRRVTS